MSSRSSPVPAPYRADVDGLRAIAVLAVVAFHAVPQWLHGGFVGVDVFFVISGYLITGILVQANDAGTFSFVQFYARRARRIFPALVLVLLATIALGALVLPVHENTRLGRHVVAGVLFSSNLLLWREAGYFDVASASKPLLHLWSLGIEEQFYLLWPAVMLVLSLTRLRRFRLAATVSIAIASFALNISMVGHDTAADFYSPATRAWELMTGAILAMISRPGAGVRLPKPWRDALSAGGALLVLAAIVWLTAETSFPGWYALMPVMGAAMILGAGPDAWLNRRILSHPMAVSVGLVSYPLYLWHWPLLVMLRRATAAGVTTPLLPSGAAIAVIALSIVAAYGTYRLLELPIRRPALVPVAARASLALAAMGVLGAIITVSRADFDRDTLTAQQARNDWATPKSDDAVYFVTASHRDPRVAFLGDSHAEQYYPSVKHALESQSSPPTVAFSTLGGCPFFPTFFPARCREAYRRAMRLASSPSVQRVVIASAWDMYLANGDQGENCLLTPAQLRASFDALEPDVARLRALGKDVVLIGSHPHAETADPELLAAHRRISRFGTTAPTTFATSFPLSAFRERTKAVNENLERLAARTGARLIDPTDVLCPAGNCLTMDDHGTPLRKDSNHLRPFAAVRYLTYTPALVSLPGSVAVAWNDHRSARARSDRQP
ncbi:MAG: acyltransferase [Gemmatimonadetes bacterium]|nr:acyltransferase [Gemmatimonadota bacterium]